MLYAELTALIKMEAQTDESDFEKATDKIKRVLFSLSKEQLLPLVKEIGAIPENIDHDSTEEKLYAKSNSQIYGQALDGNVCLLSWEHFAYFLEHNVKESKKLKLSFIWNLSAEFSKSVTISNKDKNDSFHVLGNEFICKHLGSAPTTLVDYLHESKQVVISRGTNEIEYWKAIITQIRQYTKEQAITELISAMKIDEKISAIGNQQIYQTIKGDIMNNNYIDRITQGDCHNFLGDLDNESIDLFLSDIPYGICLDDWDVLHSNTNSALLGQSPAQIGKPGFKRRGKPINGWSQADRNIGSEYKEWCATWGTPVFPKMKKGSSLFVFSGRRTIHQVINAFENLGFLLKDMLAWKKPSAHRRAQRVSIVYDRRGLGDAAHKWEGWRLGNLAPIFEPIAWFVKPYKIGGTIADNILENEVGAINVDECLINGSSPTNLLEFDYRSNEKRIHEAQKPLSLIEFLIKLTTKEGQIILDPFMGSGTTAVAARRLKRHFIGFEIDSSFYEAANVRLQEEVEIGQYQNTTKQPKLSLLEKQEKYCANKSLKRMRKKPRTA